MPLPIRMVASTLRTKKNITPKAMITRLKNDTNRLALVKNAFQITLEMMTQDELMHLLPLSFFPSTFMCIEAAAVYHQTYEETEEVS